VKYLSIFPLFLILLNGCGLFGKKSIEDSQTYQEMMKYQEETNKRLDSVRRDNYRQLNDSMNTEFRRELDSLKRSTDSLEKELEKSIENLKKIK
jgi:t-SNARE complex subunit (syntaxin)